MFISQEVAVDILCLYKQFLVVDINSFICLYKQLFGFLSTMVCFKSLYIEFRWSLYKQLWAVYIHTFSLVNVVVVCMNFSHSVCL